ncbi:MAG TPA: hypothetical protein VJO32_08660 [Ktedonobacteraceae bacterium]|nr:hypothetical protein [Ktedonobacteraceae bacterium]
MKRLNAMLIALSRAIIVSAFWAATRLSNSVKVSGLQHDRGTARSYLAMSHKRDLDPLILLPSILFHRGWRALAGNVHFFLRGDAFSPGYLARMVMHPRWLSYLLRWLSVGPVLRWLGTYPADSLQMQLEEWVRKVIQVESDGGKTRAGDILAPSIIEELAAATHESNERVASQPLARLLAWKYHDTLQHVYGPEILSGNVRRTVQQRAIVRIKKYLGEIDAWLWSGGSLYASAEGQLSPLGLLSPISTGFHRLMRTAPPETCVVPIFLTYDFMTTLRFRIFIDFAPAIERAPLLPPAELDAQLRARWLEAATFTCTQLGSGFLAQASYTGLASFTLDDLAGNIHTQAKTLAAAGRHVDAHLLNPRKTRKRARSFLKYAARHALVRRSAKRAWTPTLNEVPLNLRPTEVGYDRAPLTYALNELHEMLNGV